MRFRARILSKLSKKIDMFYYLIYYSIYKYNMLVKSLSWSIMYTFSIYYF